ncbi:probable leucine-rich repeat receptor-like protein kinase At5g63930 [Actinidia eriantha]|uniref:probable leucine-rich repeat receptor-like protein kinase At5g63930 n=1 Tax=Actinidia eriantha TaxID=165200 RepID=UPI0025831116|nr:probable leucine-rich repeat receptor-like protein kinase At5g63930 [Actinidia eriantha]
MPLLSLSTLLLLHLLLFLSLTPPSVSQPTSQLGILMALKASLDPQGVYLSSWSPSSSSDSAGPCGGVFEGVACDEQGRVVNISLQGKGLAGKIPPEIGQLTSLSGLYLHFNQLHGVVPKEIASLSELSDLYLNVNNLSGEVPPEIEKMSNLQVLQLCYNKLSGSIPTQLGSLKKLSVLALQYNQLGGAIPASLGDLTMLKRLDLSFNRLFGSIPIKLANPPMLKLLDIRNNTLSGNVPAALKRLNEGFLYANNTGLCGVGFSTLEVCSESDNLNPSKPEPFGPSSNNLPKTDIPESANFQSNCTQTHCSNQSRGARIAIIFGAIGLIVALSITGLLTFSWYRRRKQKIGSAFDVSDSRLSTDQMKEVYSRRSASPLISLEYSNGWDPMAKGWSGSGFSQEVFESFVFNLEDVESATQHFSEVNLMGKSSFSAMYKGLMRDGSVVAIKCIAKSSCKSDEAQFLKGLMILTSLKHENILRLRGFCCSKGRGECFLIYDFVPNGNLLQYLDVKASSGKVLEWSTRISIIQGIAKGIGYLHGKKGSKLALVHQNISAEKVLIDQRYNPLLSDAGLHKLLADDIIFSTLKSSAAMGYLAQEYTNTGRFTEKSDAYAFGMIIFQVLSGKRKITQLTRQGAETCKFVDFIDANLDGNFSESEAAKLGKIALLCTHESPDQRPAMVTVIQELSELCV